MLILRVVDLKSRFSEESVPSECICVAAAAPHSVLFLQLIVVLKYSDRMPSYRTNNDGVRRTESSAHWVNPNHQIDGMAKQKRSTRRKTQYDHTVRSWRSFPPILLMISSILLNAPYVIPSHFFFAEAFSYIPTAEKFGNRFMFSRSPSLLPPLKISPSNDNGESLWYLTASTENNNAFNEEDSSPRYPSSQSLPLAPNYLTTRQVLSSSPLPRKPNRKRDNVGGYDPTERIGEGIKVGDPPIKVEEKEFSVTSILRELAAIQQKGPQKYCILGTRHCSYLHQQIIELL